MLAIALMAGLLIGTGIGYGIAILLQPPPPEAANEVRIGFAYGLTGREAAIGDDIWKAAKLTIDELNKAGGIKSLGGAKIVDVWGDHQGKPELALADAERLITEYNVVTIFGARLSSCGLPIAETCERLEIPFMIVECSSPTLTTSGFKWSFRASPHDIGKTVACFELLKALREDKGHTIETVAFVYEDSLFGGGSHESWVAYNADPELGGYTVVEDFSYNAQAADVTAEVLRLKTADPDVIFMASYAADAALFQETYQLLDYMPKGIMTLNGHGKPEYLDVVGELNNYMFATEAWEADVAKPVSQAFIEKFEEAYGEEPYVAHVRVWDALHIWHAAMERAASVEPDKIRESLLQTDIPGDQVLLPFEKITYETYTSGGLNYTNQNPYANPLVVQYYNGSYHTVYPFDVASTEIVFPVPPWSERP
jgi:branched-chain amino acid transport system substrate-binding protein